MSVAAATLPVASSAVVTLADLLTRLGDVDPRRVRFTPNFGTATEKDVIAVEREEHLLCELVDRVLVEKPMGFRESLLAAAIVEALRAFVIPRNLGLVTAPDGMLRLLPGLVRIPDAAFISWDRLPGGSVPDEPIPLLAPDLAVEVLSEGNTAAEMGRKRREYFTAGTRLVWEVDPHARRVTVYTAPDQSHILTAVETLDGGGVLPGFALPLKALFAEIDRSR